MTGILTVAVKTMQMQASLTGPHDSSGEDNADAAGWLDRTAIRVALKNMQYNVTALTVTVKKMQVQSVE